MHPENLKTLWELCERQAPLRERWEEEHFHGPQHWRRVEALGLHLAEREGGDSLTVRIFAPLHDCMREVPGFDWRRGPRAIELLRQWVRESFGPRRLIGGAGLRLVEEALSFQDEPAWEVQSQISASVACCRDASVLAWAIARGVRPRPGALFTEAARGKKALELALELVPQVQLHPVAHRMLAAGPGHFWLKPAHESPLPPFLYHGTSARHEAQIRQHGLLPRAELKCTVARHRNGNGAPAVTRQDCVYLGAQQALAYAFGEAAAQEGRPCLLVARVYPEDLEPAHLYQFQPTIYLHHGTIPARLLTLCSIPQSALDGAYLRSGAHKLLGPAQRNQRVSDWLRQPAQGRYCFGILHNAFGLCARSGAQP